MNRELAVKKMQDTPEWDFIIIGGGATGLGTAVDSASRGYKTILFEGADFAKGTSSRSTKLVHGGVRYLAQGNVKLVIEALRERGLLAKNAAHLFRNQTFLIPNYNWWGGWYYAFGLKLYDLLSKKLSLGKSRLIKSKTAIQKIPTLKNDGLQSAVLYRDGQFDDSRLAINLAQTVVREGGTVINYMKVTDVIKDETGALKGVQVTDQETGETHEVFAKIVINATGVFANKILKMNGRQKKAIKVVPSQGVHIVLDQSFLPGNHALMIPKTPDGRVLFAIPWHQSVVVGTTDTPIKKPSYEPRALDSEVDFILETASEYLTKKPERKDVRAVFAGLRPLVAPEGDKKNTKEISRGHQILISESGLISILGGKWTTYRQMAEEIVDTALKEHNLSPVPCQTKTLTLQGGGDFPDNLNFPLSLYGSDSQSIRDLEQSRENGAEKIHPKYDYTVAMVIWGVNAEMARNVEDILARRIRLLFTDARAAIECAPKVAEIMAEELGRPENWKREQIEKFTELANVYTLN